MTAKDHRAVSFLLMAGTDEIGRDVLTAMDVVLRLEAKVDVVLEDHEERLRTLEKAGFRLSGAWATVGIISATLSGTAGLAVGALAYLTGG